jgi:membrane associated rhomboid family serine protease
VRAILIAICVSTSLVQWLFYAYYDGGEVFQVSPAWREILGLSLRGLRAHHFWQFLSYGLLQAGVLHLAINVTVLFFVGREVEPIVGRRHFLGLFLAGYVAGAMVQCVAMAAHWGPALLLGVSAGAAAVFAAHAAILPELETNFFFFSRAPFRMRTRTFGVIASGVILLSCAAVSPGAQAWSAATHGAGGAVVTWIASLAPISVFGGLLVGWVYVKAIGYGSPLAIQRYYYQRRQREERLARMPAEQFIVEEIDPILEKISRQGMQSLTRAERKILARGREKIGSGAEPAQRSKDIRHGATRKA